MGRNKTPTAILDAKGAFIHDPQRARVDEPKGGRPLTKKPPKYLQMNEKEIELWKVLHKRLLPGVAFESDEVMFADYVRLTLKWIEREPMMAAERTYRLSLASRFAMTPADRSKVQAEQPKESALTKFLNRRKDRADAAESVQ